MELDSFIVQLINPLTKDLGVKESKMAKELSPFQMEAFIRVILRLV